MNFRNWLISEEIYPNKTATVYHRTRRLDDIGNILSKGFSAGEQGGCMYGCGLYTTFDLRSQFDSYMERYGSYIVKFKITNLENYLITPLNVAKYILGKDYKISDQFKKRIIKNPSLSKKLAFMFQTQSIEDVFSEYDKKQATEQYSSDLLLKLLDEKGFILHADPKISGAIYRGKQDGYCLVKYEPINDSTITMLGYADAPVLPGDQSRLDKLNQLLNNQGWETSTSKEKIKSIWQRPIEKRPAIELKDNAMKLVDLAKSNQLFKFKKLLDDTPELTNKELYEILKAAQDKVKTLKMIMQHQELNSKNIYHILDGNLENKKEMAEVLGKENIEKLTGDAFSYALDHSSNFDQAKEIIDIVLKHKSKLASTEVYSILVYSKNKKEMAERLGERNVRKLGDHSFYIFDLLRLAVDKKEMAKILGQENINKLETRDIRNLLTRTANKKEMAEILGDNIKKMSPHDVYSILFEQPNEESKQHLKDILKSYGWNLEGPSYKWSHNEL